MLSASMQTPMTTTWPWRPTIPMAAPSVDLTPIHSKTTSGGRPVIDFTASAGSSLVGLTTALAPSFIASSVRPGASSDTTTALAPLALAHINVERPMGPAPITTTPMPGSIDEWLTPWRPTESGSTSAPARELTLAGSLSRLAVLHATNSAYAPGSWPSPRLRSLEQCIASSRWHHAHTPHAKYGRDVTRSPIR